MKKRDNFCQSCGMPLSNDPHEGGTNADGTKSVIYCSFCYQRGFFTFEGSLKEFQEHCRLIMIKGGMPKFMAWLYAKSIRNLPRWKK